MGKELELKFGATPALLQTLQDRYGGFTAVTMETHYYDTQAGDLGARRWTLRRRLENGLSLCTLKTPGDRQGRGEWEAEAPSIEAGIRALCAQDVPEDFSFLVSPGVQEVCGARFTRLCRLLSPEGCTLELALDQGVFLGGGRELPFREIEAELKSGSREALAAFGKTLADTYHLQLQPLSKFQRALALSQEATNG